MKIKAVDVFVLGFPMKAVFVLAGGVAGRPGTPTERVIVRLATDQGAVGWGEATPTPRWTYETTETIVATLKRHVVPAILGLDAWDLDAVHRAMQRAIAPGVTMGSPLAKSAIDVALHDALARSYGIPLYQLLGRRKRSEFDLTWMVTCERPEHADRLAHDGLEAGYTCFEGKIGMHGEAGDIDLVRRVRKAIGGNAMQVDANRGYRVDAAIRQARRFEEFGVTLFEQPLDGFNLSGFRRLVAASPVPIGIDETLRSLPDLLEYIRADALTVAVAKVQRNGGLWYSRQLCEMADAAGLGLSLSGLTETDLGLAAGMHLAAAFDISPLQLNGPQYIETTFLKERVWRGGGRVKLPEGPGLGVEVDEAYVRKHAVKVSLD
ncbi:MAG TPA: enolase C-terminal domain-like protein [Candidatus Cybelea sp.]|nr:enolase C-terminal domain-like protein [Candidatus Cybelea sp.]